MKPKNIFQNIPTEIHNEIFEPLAQKGTLKIERILSRGHSSPADFWYDQPENEWVIVLKGWANLQFEQQAELVTLGPGDFINIPAHCKHRVDGTDPHTETVWLAVFYG